MQGRLRGESLTFNIRTECACCGREIRFRMNSDLSFILEDETSDPVFFIPMVDFSRLKAPSIIDDF
ncbi:MAG: hypothetical protein KA369_11060 [Spirochaetes bacterium]|nr:hypothetical protein [Spirochaetota bacterium]